MGVDYNAVGGVGVMATREQLVAMIGEQKLEDDFYDDIEDAIDETFGAEGIFLATSGSASYSGGDDTYYLCIRDPFSDGYDLRDKVDQFKDTLRKSGFDDFSDVDVFCDLYIH